MKQTTFILIAFAVVIAVVAVLNRDRIKQYMQGLRPGGTSGGNSPVSGGAVSGGSNTKPQTLDLNKVLKKGVYDSAEVTKLQQWLNTKPQGGAIAVDGDFGSGTETKLFAITGKKQITLAQVITSYNAGMAI